MKHKQIIYHEDIEMIKSKIVEELTQGNTLLDQNAKVAIEVNMTDISKIKQES